MSHIGACGTEDTLELHTGDNVWVFAVGVGRVRSGIKRDKPRRKDNSASAEGHSFFLLFKVDGVCGAEFFTGPTLPFLEVDAVFLVNDIFQRNRLGIFNIDGLTFDQVPIKRVIDLFRTFFRAGPACDALVHLHITWVSENLYLKIPGLSANSGKFS